MTKDEALKLALETLENNKQMHYYCEDTWYSCPQHEEKCANDSVGDECNCGANEANAEIDKAITALKEALAQPEQEPIGEVVNATDKAFECRFVKILPIGTKFYTTPPQPKPRTDEQIDEEFKLYASKFDTSSDKWLDMGADDYFKAGFKAAHGIKE